MLLFQITYQIILQILIMFQILIIMQVMFQILMIMFQNIFQIISDYSLVSDLLQFMF